MRSTPVSYTHLDVYKRQVLALCDECPGYIPPPPQQKKRPEFILPPAAVNNRRVFAYLLKRGIDRKVIEACIRAGILYESADYHNAVFVGRDETGTCLLYTSSFNSPNLQSWYN